MPGQCDNRCLSRRKCKVCFLAQVSSFLYIFCNLLLHSESDRADTEQLSHTDFMWVPSPNLVCTHQTFQACNSTTLGSLKIQHWRAPFRLPVCNCQALLRNCASPGSTSQDHRELLESQCPAKQEHLWSPWSLLKFDCFSTELLQAISMASPTAAYLLWFQARFRCRSHKQSPWLLF